MAFQVDAPCVRCNEKTTVILGSGEEHPGLSSRWAFLCTHCNNEVGFKITGLLVLVDDAPPPNAPVASRL